MTSAAKSVSKLKAAQMDAFSLSGAHTNCLCRLHEAGSLTQGELTRLEQMDRSQVSRVLRDLAQKGYVVSDTQAGYKRRYTLTPAGEQTAARVEPSFWISIASSAMPFPTQILRFFTKP